MKLEIKRFSVKFWKHPQNFRYKIILKQHNLEKNNKWNKQILNPYGSSKSLKI